MMKNLRIGPGRRSRRELKEVIISVWPSDFIHRAAGVRMVVAVLARTLYSHGLSWEVERAELGLSIQCV